MEQAVRVTEQNNSIVVACNLRVVQSDREASELASFNLVT